MLKSEKRSRERVWDALVKQIDFFIYSSIQMCTVLYNNWTQITEALSLILCSNAKRAFAETELHNQKRYFGKSRRYFPDGVPENVENYFSQN